MVVHSPIYLPLLCSQPLVGRLCSFLELLKALTLVIQAQDLGENFSKALVEVFRTL